MSDALICDGPLTLKLLEQILASHLKTSATLASCHGELIGSGSGFTSEIICITLQWSGCEKNESLPKKVIAKTPKSQRLQESINTLSRRLEITQSDPTLMSVDIMAKLIHDAECNAYKVLLMEPEAPPVPLPLIYCHRMTDPPVIVMEDMSLTAGNVDIARGLTLSQWQSIADCLADLHAWSLTTTVPWRQHVGGTETVAKIYETWFKMMAGALKATKEKYRDFAEVDEKLLERELEFSRVMGNYDKYREVLPDVMQHGDTWTNNIFFRKDDQGQVSNHVAAFIDWQLCFAGCGLNDLGRLSFMCIDHQLRRSMARQIVERYFSRFVSKAGDKIDGNRVTLERVWKVFQHILAVNGLMCAVSADFFLRFMAQADDPSDSRHIAILNRLKAGYDDAVQFFSQSDYDKF